MSTAAAPLRFASRPVTAEEAAHPQGALVAVAEGLAPGDTKAQTAIIIATAAANGVAPPANPDNRDCRWARDLAGAVLARGGRRGPAVPDNRCEPGKGFAIIMPGNVWALPTTTAPATAKKAGKGLLALALAFLGYRWWKG